MLPALKTPDPARLEDGLLPFAPSGAALLVVALLLIGLRLALDKARNSSSKSFRIHVIMLVATAAGLIVVALLLPEELRRHGIALIGIVFGAMVTLSSPTILGNALAGVQLRSVNAFKAGDFLSVGEHFGRVTERGLFHTEIQTEDADLTTLPNLYLVSHPYKVVSAAGTIISATVSLGYDVSRQKVEQSLVAVATRLELENPFVQVLELGDYSVTYRVAGRLSSVEHILTYRSRLRIGVLDELHGAGIEIVSPSFMTTRALKPGEKVIPESPRSVTGPEKEPVEEVIFDKAGRAATLEEMTIRLELLPEEISETTKALKAAEEADQPRLQREIEALEQEKETLPSQIAALREEIRAHEEEGS